MTATLTRHDLTHVPLDALSVSPLNVRKHGPKDIASLAQSIRAQGLLQPLLARQSGDGFEVVAGSRRLKALDLITREDATPSPSVPCLLIAPGDDAAAIEASLAENIARLPMDEIDQYQAFAALIKQGRSEDEIAEQFGTTPLIVRRRLALARLIPDIHRLYRAGEIDADTIKLLTLAPKERQRAYVALMRDPDQQPPPRWQLKAWLLGGAEIDTRHALFDETLYRGDISGDLFGEARYFLDAEQFWRLQNEAIAHLSDDLAAKGWSHVHVTSPDQPFYPHQWQEVRKADGGHAVIEVKGNGAVEVHKGLLSPDDARKAQRTRAKVAAEATGMRGDSIRDSSPGEDDDTGSERPELSAPLANYCDLIRLSTVKAALLKQPKLALRIMVLRFLAASTHITAAREPMTATSAAIKASLDALASEATVSEARKTVCALLDLSDDDPLIGWGYDSERPSKLLAKLMTLTDAQVIQIAAVTAADTLALGTTLVDTVGETLKADCLKHWQPDDAFFDLIRDREVTTALLSEVIGDEAARSYLTETGPKKKEIIKNALAGRNREKVSGWRPRWMAFPQTRYTTRPLTGRGRPAA